MNGLLNSPGFASIRFCSFRSGGYNAVSVCSLAKLQGGRRLLDATQRRSRSVTIVPIPKESGVFLPGCLLTRHSRESGNPSGWRQMQAYQMDDTVGLVIVKYDYLPVSLAFAGMTVVKTYKIMQPTRKAIAPSFLRKQESIRNAHTRPSMRNNSHTN